MRYSVFTCRVQHAPFNVLFMAGAAIAVLVSASANAQVATPAANSASDDGSALQEVVVVAQKRSESLQSVPISISAFKASALADANVTSLQGITTLDTSLIIGEGTGQAIPFLRGVGNPIRNIGDEASTSIYVDGVYYSRIPAALFELNSIQQVEVLKGPQGTLFGRNSEGGLIDIITRDPSRSPTLEASAGYGSFDTFRGSLYGSIGLGDKAAIDFSALEINQGQGWGKDLVTGARNGYEDVSAFRTKLVLQPTERTQIKLSADYINTRSTDGLSSNAYEGTTQGTSSAPLQQLPSIPFYDTQNNISNVADEKGATASARIQQDLGFANLVSLTAYRRTTENILQDGDDSPQNFLNVDIKDYSDQTSQEFQLVSKRDSKINWILGFYYLDQVGAYTPVREYGSHFGSNVIEVFSKNEDASYAGYGQVDIQIVPRLKLTLGGRYTTDDVSGSGHTDILTPATTVSGKLSEASKTYDKATYKAALDYTIAPSSIAYASYTTGFKAGVFASLPFTPTPVAPETIKAYEVGEKTELFDHRLRLNGAFFYYDIANVQVQPVTLSPTISTLIVNAASAHSEGFDFNGEAAISRTLSATFGFTALDAKYDRFTNAPFYSLIATAPFGNGSLTDGDASGKYLPRSPKFAFNLGFNYRLFSEIGQWMMSANYAYNSGYFWDPDNLHKQSAVGLLDANVSYRLHTDDRWALRLWVKNLTNEKYYWGENETAGPTGTPGVVAPPRTFGVSVNYKLDGTREARFLRKGQI